eukprot:scaffold35429_cov94-Phaeocystis_antarctica.AAC.1
MHTCAHHKQPASSAFGRSPHHHLLPETSCKSKPRHKSTAPCGGIAKAGASKLFRCVRPARRMPSTLLVDDGGSS